MTKTTTTKTTKLPSRAAIAEHLIVSVRTLRRLIEEKKLPSSGTLDDYRTQYIEHLREVAAGRAAKTEGVDLVASRAGLADRQKERIEFDLAVRRGRYCEVEFVGQQVEALFAVVREVALGLPGVYADQLAMKSRVECFEILQLAINGMLTSLCDGADQELVRRAAAEAMESTP
jgi:phage terminase Nu1 subunit (DNA packaging protein)